MPTSRHVYQPYHCSTKETLSRKDPRLGRAHSELLRQMGEARDDLAQLHHRLDALAKQIDSIDTDVRRSGNRVLEIEQHLTQAQQDNVDLQVRLENTMAIHKQSGSLALQIIRHMRSKVTLVAQENSQLQEQLVALAHHQQTHLYHLNITGNSMQEYSRMLEQAQDVLQRLRSSTSCSRRQVGNTIRTVPLSHAQSDSSIPPDVVEHYRHRIIRKQTPLSSASYRPRQHPMLSFLLQNHAGLRLLLPSKLPSTTANSTVCFPWGFSPIRWPIGP